METNKLTPTQKPVSKVAAFLLALLLFLLTAAACHFYVRGRVAVNNPSFSTWPLEEKGTSFVGITENMNEATFPVFGSSEFQHGKETAFHPINVFSGNRFQPMLIGAGYYQSLSHAITLAAIEPSISHRKAVLLLSPQWFRKPGVIDQAFTSRFSEILYARMLQNENLSDAVKEYISSRTMSLLAIDPTTQEHVTLHDKVLWKNEGTSLENAKEKIWLSFLEEKDYFNIAMRMTAAGIKKGTGLRAEDSVPDWTALLLEAEQLGEQENQNEFFIDDESYEKLLPVLPDKKGMNHDAKTGYQNSPEYDDLRCFLTVCQDLGIEPMLVIVPVNGYYYDYTEFPREARQGYYEKIRGVADEFGVKTADFSGEEFTKYFFEDRVHIGKKGWVTINESIYNFYREN